MRFSPHENWRLKMPGEEQNFSYSRKAAMAFKESAK